MGSSIRPDKRFTENKREKPLSSVRKLNPSDISLPPGYKIEVFAANLTTPISMVFNEKGEILVADSGILSGSGKVIKLTTTGYEIIAEGFNPPLTGINIHNGNIYVSHRGFITIVKPDGTKEDILSGLPSWGDHHNNKVEFGSDGKMYFGQGTATNSGVVGADNADWVKKYPQFHDFPGAQLILNGQNFITHDILAGKGNDISYTGAYSPYGTPGFPGEVVKGNIKASGSILRANTDGSQLELIAWGLRNPFRLKFDRYGNLFAANHGMDVRGSRPVDNSPDELQLIRYGMWYGWPDYTGGLPITLPQFKPEGESQPSFLIANHPMIPPKPFVNFPIHAAVMGFDFNYNNNFGYSGDAFIALFGSEAPETTGGKPLPKVGHRVSRIDMQNGSLFDFAVNKSGYPATYNNGGGFERPIDVAFDKGGAMYVVDFGIASPEDIDAYIPGSGVIWKITRA